VAHLTTTGGCGDPPQEAILRLDRSRAGRRGWEDTIAAIVDAMLVTLIRSRSVRLLRNERMYVRSGVFVC